MGLLKAASNTDAESQCRWLGKLSEQLEGEPSQAQSEQALGRGIDSNLGDPRRGLVRQRGLC